MLNMRMGKFVLIESIANMLVFKIDCKNHVKRIRFHEVYTVFAGGGICNPFALLCEPINI